MNVMVCGGAGYIGSNMVSMLRAKGHRAVVYDNLSKGHRAAVEGVEFVQGDIGDAKAVTAALERYEIEAVMHFAAFIEVGESVAEPMRYFQNNTYRTAGLLDAMGKAGVRKFIFSSTAAVYGAAEEVPLRESSVTKPINPYGESKLEVERLCHFLSEAGELRYAALRYFNAAGAGDGCRLGEDHRPESHLIPLVIAAAMGKRESVAIYGTDYETQDGTCVRDYIHVEDLCAAHILALEKLEGARELVYNLGNGKGYSVREVIEAVKRVSGKEFKVVEAGRRAGDPPVLTSDAGKARKELGWKVKFAELEGIVETAWKWHSKFPHGYKDS